MSRTSHVVILLYPPRYKNRFDSQLIERTESPNSLAKRVTIRTHKISLLPSFLPSFLPHFLRLFQITEFLIEHADSNSAMSVHFKFRSSRNYDSVDIGGQPSISVRDLKSSIVQNKKLNLCQDFDLLFSDPISGQGYLPLSLCFNFIICLVAFASSYVRIYHINQVYSYSELMIYMVFDSYEWRIA